MLALLGLLSGSMWTDGVCFFMSLLMVTAVQKRMPSAGWILRCYNRETLFFDPQFHDGNLT